MAPAAVSLHRSTAEREPTRPGLQATRAAAKARACKRLPEACHSRGKMVTTVGGFIYFLSFCGIDIEHMVPPLPDMR